MAAGAIAEAAMGAVEGIGNLALGEYNYIKSLREARSQRRQRANAVDEARSNALSELQGAQDLINTTYGSLPKFSTGDTIQQYTNIMNTYDPNKYAYDFDKFNYDKNVEDFMNPEAEKIAQLAGLKTQAGLAGQGAAGGSMGGAGIGYAKWEAARDLYKDAQQQYNMDRQQAYGEYSDFIQNAQNRLNILSQQTMNKYNMLGGAISHDEAQKQDYVSDLLGVMGDKANVNIQAGINKYA